MIKFNKYTVDHIVKNEESAAKHINIISHRTDDTLIDKSGRLIKIFKIKGLNAATLDEKSLDLYKIRRNHLLKSFSSEIAFYFWQIRKKINAFPEGEFSDAFAKSVNQKYENKITKTAMFHTEHYLAVIAKEPEGFFNRGMSFINLLSRQFDHEAKKAHLNKLQQLLNEAALRIKNSLADYGCELLSIYERDNFPFSSLLSFVSQLINFGTYSFPFQILKADKELIRNRLFFNRRAGIVEIRNDEGDSTFAAVLSIKIYSPETYQGILNELNQLPFKYVITQSFAPYDRQAAKGRMRDQQKEMLQSKEESTTLTEEIDEFYDEAASGALGYGIHHYTLTCYADNQEKLNQQVGIIISLFSDVDITCVREGMGCELGFWAQLPGNFPYICRPADISTRNMASFINLYHDPLGKLTHNWWGDAVTVFETLSGSPYYFNFHYRDVGNFLIFGAMGSGKTVLIGFLILQSMKFGGKRIIFDKDRGLEIMVRAMGGIYERIKPGNRTGFNPCHLEDSKENRNFLLALFKKMLSTNGEILSEENINRIESAISGLYAYDKKDRKLSELASYFGAKKPRSLRARFDEWHSDGQYAWLFDNDEDSLNLDANIIGFDLGHLLSEKECKTPALMYLLYRVEAALAGERGMLFCDEGWQYLDDEYFSKSINDWSRTPRKKNNIFGLATQVANDTVHSAISKSINESAFCKIFFPNPSADKNVHMNEFGLTAKEFELVKTLPDDQHYFLLIHGRSVNKESVVLKANLKGLEDEIAIISAREETLAILDQLLIEVGFDPNKWLSLFHERRKKVT